MFPGGVPSCPRGLVQPGVFRSPPVLCTPEPRQQLGSPRWPFPTAHPSACCPSSMGLKPMAPLRGPCHLSPCHQALSLGGRWQPGGPGLLSTGGCRALPCLSPPPPPRCCVTPTPECHQSARVRLPSHLARARMASGAAWPQRRQPTLCGTPPHQMGRRHTPVSPTLPDAPGSPAQAPTPQPLPRLPRASPPKFELQIQPRRIPVRPEYSLTRPFHHETVNSSSIKMFPYNPGTHQPTCKSMSLF